jgi:hypothetical protein
VLGDTLERLRSAICFRFSRDPLGERVNSQQTSSLSRAQHSLCTAGHDNGQTAEKRRSRQAIDRRVSALATSKTGLGRCSACTDVLTEVGPPVRTESGMRPTQEHRNRQARTREQDAILTSCLPLQRKRVGPTTRLSSPFAHAWDRGDGKTSAGVVTGRSARPGLSMPGSDRQHRNRACSI